MSFGRPVRVHLKTYPNGQVAGDARIFVERQEDVLARFAG
jgi:hypothetical protein